jgi:hypothetical protein
VKHGWWPGVIRKTFFSLRKGIPSEEKYHIWALLNVKFLSTWPKGGGRCKMEKLIKRWWENLLKNQGEWKDIFYFFLKKYFP